MKESRNFDLQYGSQCEVMLKLNFILKKIN